MATEEPSVKRNTALQSLYGLGGFLTAVGLVVLVIGWAIAATPSYDGAGPSFGGIAALIVGAGLTNIGFLFLAAGGAAHAVNWQLVNREVTAERIRPMKTYGDYAESKETPPPADWP